MARKVAFVRLRSLGDMVLMTPGLEAAKRQGYEVGVVAEAPFHQVLEGNPSVDDLFLLPGRRASWIERAGMIRALRRWGPDTVIDLHGGTTAAFITRLSGASIRAGFQGGRNSALYNRPVPDSRAIWGKDDVHTVEHQLAPLKHLGFQVEPIPPLVVPVRHEAAAGIDRRLAQRGIEAGFVLVHPSAAFDTKQWAPEKFASLADSLEGDGHQVVLTAGPGEDALIEQVRGSCRSGPEAFPPLPLPRFAALASRCGLYVGNDTGPTHIACALKRPVVAVFGSSDWKVWRPWGTRHRLVKADLPCIPCPGYTCHLYEQPRCIRSIEVGEVLEAARDLLREARSAESHSSSA